MSTKRLIKLSMGAVMAVAALVLTGLNFVRAEKPSSTPHVVKIAGMSFVPKVITVQEGDAVTWVNQDIMMHAVKASDGADGWQSMNLQPNESWSRVFSHGEDYICPYHPMMTGKIIVSE